MKKNKILIEVEVEGEEALVQSQAIEVSRLTFLEAINLEMYRY